MPAERIPCDMRSRPCASHLINTEAGGKSPGSSRSRRARCYQYTQFCRHYHAWAGTLEPVLRRVHVAGERLFVDYAGPTMPIVHPRTTASAE